MRSFFLLVLLGLGFASGLSAATESPADLGRRWAAYAQGLAGQARHAEAGPAFDKALQLQPGDAAILRSRGQWHWSQGRRDAALEDLRASLAADSGQAALKAWLDRLAAPAPQASAVDEEALLEAQALLEGRDFAGALAVEAERGSRPRSAAWLRLRSESLYGLGRFDESRQALKEARALDPEDAALLRLEQRYYHSALAPDGGGGPVFPPLWRSALLPGWGQAYNGQKRKAWITGVLTLSLLAATAYTYAATDQALAEYRGLGPGAADADFDAAFGKADGLAVLNQALGIGFYAAYAYNLFDAAAGARAPLRAPDKVSGLRVTLLALRY